METGKSYVKKSGTKAPSTGYKLDGAYLLEDPAIKDSSRLLPPHRTTIAEKKEINDLGTGVMKAGGLVEHYHDLADERTGLIDDFVEGKIDFIKLSKERGKISKMEETALTYLLRIGGRRLSDLTPQIIQGGKWWET